MTGQIPERTKTMQIIIRALRCVVAAYKGADQKLTGQGLPGLLAMTLGLIGLIVMAFAFLAPALFGAAGFQALAGVFLFALTMLLIAIFSDIFWIVRSR
jgi:hypothetical protein